MRNPPRAYSLGRKSYCDQRIGNAHFLFLDTRSYRGEGDPRNPGRTDVSMLGPAQKAWVMETMIGRGGLPPISLLSFLVCLAPIVVKMRTSRSDRQGVSALGVVSDLLHSERSPRAGSVPAAHRAGP